MFKTGGSLWGRFTPTGVLLSVLFTVGCAGGGSDGGSQSGNTGTNLGGDDPPPPPPVINYAPGAKVAEFELAAPVGNPAQQNAFMLRGTLPVPHGVFHGTPGTESLGVADFDGSIVAAQVETLARYADGQPSIVEVAARLHRDPAKTPGMNTRVVYPVHYLVDATGASFQSGVPTQGVPSSIQNLLADPNGVLVLGTDVFGNPYTALPLGSHAKSYRQGGYLATERGYAVMMPSPAVSGATGTLPSMFGVHAYATKSFGESVLGLDIRLNNGVVGSDTAHQDPIRPLYFQSLKLCVPTGYIAMNSLLGPSWDPVGQPLQWNGKSYMAFSLMKPLAGGAMHVIPKQGQMHFRLAITVAGNEPRAQAALDLEGLAFNRAGLDDLGQELWSWWNPLSANLLQGHVLPSLGFWGATNLRTYLANRFTQDKQVFESGVATAVYPWMITMPGRDLAAGIQYGGMTGGTDICQDNGVEIAYASSTEGVREAALLHQGNTNRQPWALFNPDGSPICITQLFSGSGSAKQIPFKFFQIPEGTAGLGYFKLNQSANFQETYVANNGLKPAYEADLFAFAPHDFQHQIRSLKNLFVLLSFCNDPLAKDDLELAANIGRLESPEVWVAGTHAYGVLNALQFGTSHPGLADGHFGRGQGWAAMANAVFFSTADDVWRAHTGAWIDMTIDAADKVRSCIGVLYASQNSKSVNPSIRMRQHFEQMIWTTALHAFLRNVYENSGSPRESTLRNVIAQSARSFIDPVAFSPNQGPWKFLGVTDASLAQPLCALPVPPNWAGQVDNYMIWDTYAMGYEMTQDPIFIDKAIESCGGTMASLKTYLEKINYGSNLGNNSKLLETMQKLNWVAP